MTTTSPLASLAGVTKIYGDGDTQVTALTDADLSVYPGEILLIVGPSGSGKTTLISILGLLMRPTRGDVFIRGERVSALRERDLPPIRAGAFGFVFQGFNLFPALTAQENVAIAIKMKQPRARNADAEARRLLAAVGLANRMHHKPADLSGGQKQRVAIARALAGDPAIIVGDEPTAALDTRTALDVMALLRSRAGAHGRAVVVVTHDPRLERFADRVARVEDGRVTAVDTISHPHAA
jgi:putative ABC transport system ATP-binding protein